MVWSGQGSRSAFSAWSLEPRGKEREEKWSHNSLSIEWPSERNSSGNLLLVVVVVVVVIVVVIVVVFREVTGLGRKGDTCDGHAGWLCVLQEGCRANFLSVSAHRRRTMRLLLT